MIPSVAFVGHSEGGKSTLIAACTLPLQHQTRESLGNLRHIVNARYEKNLTGKKKKEDGLTVTGGDFVVTHPISSERALFLDTPGRRRYIATAWARASMAQTVVVVVRSPEPADSLQFLMMAYGVALAGTVQRVMVLFMGPRCPNILEKALFDWWGDRQPPLLIQHCDLDSDDMRSQVLKLLDILTKRPQEGGSLSLLKTGDGPRFHVFLKPKRAGGMPQYRGVMTSLGDVAHRLRLNDEVMSRHGRLRLTGIVSYPLGEPLTEVFPGHIVELRFDGGKPSPSHTLSRHSILWTTTSIPPRRSGIATTLELLIRAQWGGRDDDDMYRMQDDPYQSVTGVRWCGNQTVNVHIRGEHHHGYIDTSTASSRAPGTLRIVHVHLEIEAGDVVLVTFGTSLKWAICTVTAVGFAEPSLEEIFFPLANGGISHPPTLPADTIIKVPFCIPPHYLWDLPHASPLGVSIFADNEVLFQHYLTATTSLDMINRAAYIAVVGSMWAYLTQVIRKHTRRLIEYTDSSKCNFAALALEHHGIPPHVLQEVVQHMKPSHRMLTYLACVLRGGSETSLGVFNAHFNPSPEPNVVLNMLGLGHYSTLVQYGVLEERELETLGCVRNTTLMMITNSLEKPFLSSIQYGWTVAIQAMLESPQDIVPRPLGLTRDMFAKFVLQSSDHRILSLLAVEPEVQMLSFDFTATLRLRLHRNVRRLLTMWSTPFKYFKVRPAALTLGGTVAMWSALHSLIRVTSLAPETMQHVLSFV